MHVYKTDVKIYMKNAKMIKIVNKNFQINTISVNNLI